MKAPDSGSEPIACSLDAGAYRERLAWIADLTRSTLRSVRRDGARLILTYDPQADEGVRDMVRREQKCCTFLRFELNQGDDALMLAITAPEEARDALEALFEPFLTNSCASGRCGCGTAVR